MSVRGHSLIPRSLNRLASLGLALSFALAATVAPVPGSSAIGHAASNPTNPNRFDSKSSATSVNRVAAAPQSGPAPANSSTPAPFIKDHHFSLVPTAFPTTPSVPSHFLTTSPTLTTA